jgi:hypothetical protein
VEKRRVLNTQLHELELVEESSEVSSSMNVTGHISQGDDDIDQRRSGAGGGVFIAP